MHILDQALADKKLPLLMKAESFGRVVKEMKLVAPRARRFVFGAAESEFVGNFIRDFGKTIIENRQFAIPPYESTYIEFRVDALIRGIGRVATGDVFGASDQLCGFLIHKNHVWVVAGGFSGEAAISPVHFHFATTARDEGLFSDDKENNDWIKMAYALGTLVHDLPDEQTRQDILDTIDVQCAVPGFARRQEIMGYFGDVRNLWALLLILNRQTGHVSYEAVPPKAVMFRGKRRVYAAHSIVRVALDQKEQIFKTFSVQNRESPRRHQVRGSFRHYHKVEGCEHQYPMIPTDRRWVCEKCGTVRVWVAEYERGDAAKGYKTKEYEVRKGEEE